MKDKNKMLSWGIYLSSALVVFLICAVVWGLFTESDTLQVVRILADSFFIPGALFVGIALIGWMSTKGAYDIFGYSIRGLLSMWKKESYFKSNSYYDYKQKKDAERKPFNKQMLFVGLIFLALGVIATVVFMMLDK